ncbi:hypothetical protein BgiBS90_028896 [Biomphalaria glabrata]|nr:hypothetical protein BgiBS90_028896 [Biomphalaria glabrata]
MDDNEPEEQPDCCIPSTPNILSHSSAQIKNVNQRQTSAANTRTGARTGTTNDGILLTKVTGRPVPSEQSGIYRGEPRFMYTEKIKCNDDSVLGEHYNYTDITKNALLKPSPSYKDVMQEIYPSMAPIEPLAPSMPTIYQEAHQANAQYRRQQERQQELQRSREEELNQWLDFNNPYTPPQFAPPGRKVYYSIPACV